MVRKHRRAIVEENGPVESHEGIAQGGFAPFAKQFSLDKMLDLYFLIPSIKLLDECLPFQLPLHWCGVNYRLAIAEIRGKLITAGVTYSRENLSSAIPITLSRLLYRTNKNKQRISRVCRLFRVNRKVRHRSIRKEVKIINKIATTADADRFVTQGCPFILSANKRFAIGHRVMILHASPRR